MGRCDELIRAIKAEQLNSEEDVRSKIVVKLLSALGYPSEFTATEVPVYYNLGRNVPQPKMADVICYTQKTTKPTRDVSLSDEYRDTTLLVVEVKKPGEDLGDARTQAEFYTHWTRAPFYCVTDGRAFAFYRSVLNAADKSVLTHTPDDLSAKWPQIYSELSYAEAKRIKLESVSERERFHPVLAEYCEQVAQLANYEAAERTIRKGDSSCSVSAAELIEDDSSILITGDPGIGKSELMKSLASSLARDYLKGNVVRIPVLVNARGWARQYNTIVDGVANEISRVSPEISRDFIIEHPELFCLLVDGLDEVRLARDLFFDEIARYAQHGGARLICSSRFESDWLSMGIESAVLEEYSDEQVAAHLEAGGIDSPYTVTHDLTEAGRKIIRNPLHLSCLIRYIKHRGNNRIPKNLAVIYGECINNMLESKINPDGGIDASYLRYQLGSYALERLLKPDAPSLRLFLTSRTTPDEADRIERYGKASGLLVTVNCEIEFSHSVFQEYLAASYLASQSLFEIEVFCEKHGHEQLLTNFFKILCGCMQSDEKQSVVFNYLEKNNLALYMECLRGRLNLSERVQENLSKADIEQIVEQALKSYAIISEQYLGAAKPYIPFWSSLSQPSAPIRAEVRYSPFTTVMHIELKEKYEGDKNILVELSDDAEGPIVKTANGTAVPILSFRVSNRPELHIYRIKDVYGGIDCAREIAVSMINDDVKGFFNSAITVMAEPLAMRAGFVEDALKCTQIRYQDSEGRRHPLSLRNCQAGAFARALSGTPNYQMNVDGMSFPVGYLAFLIRSLEIENGDHIGLLRPDPDNVSESVHWVWDAYKDETIIEWCKTALLECEQSYRRYIETFMKDLGPYLPTYAEGPFLLRVAAKKGSGDDFSSGWRFRVARCPVEKDEDAKVELVTDYLAIDYDDEGFAKRASEFRQAARMLGRPGSYYSERTESDIGMLGDYSYVRRTVIERVKKEIESLFKLR